MGIRDWQKRRLGLFALLIGLFVCALILNGSDSPRKESRAPTVAPAVVVAAAAVVLTAIGGLSVWVNDQMDDCKAAGLGAAWGTDCSLTKRESSRSGYLEARVRGSETLAENACGWGYGDAVAKENLLGSWAGQKIRPEAKAEKKALHAQTPDDVHKGKGWAKADVDGDCALMEVETPSVEQTGAHFFAELSIDTVVLQTRAGKSSVSRDTLRLAIDGVTKFWSVVSLDSTGLLTVTGDLSTSLFTQTYDPVSQSYQALLTNYQTSIPVVEVTYPQVDTVNVAFTASAYGEDGERKSSPPVPALGTWGALCLVLIIIAFGVFTVSRRRSGLTFGS